MCCLSQTLLKEPFAITLPLYFPIVVRHWRQYPRLQRKFRWHASPNHVHMENKHARFSN